jgi:hypothetical protein
MIISYIKFVCPVQDKRGQEFYYLNRQLARRGCHYPKISKIQFKNYLLVFLQIYCTWGMSSQGLKHFL